MPGMRRREFITLVGGAAAAWPLAARAQQGERVRRIGVLLPGTANDSEFQIRLGAFVQALALLGWDIGRNVSFDTRWATSNAAELDRDARVSIGAGLGPPIGIQKGPQLLTARTSKYPPAKPGALDLGRSKRLLGSLTRPQICWAT